MADKSSETEDQLPSKPIPAEILSQYSVTGDIHREIDIASYVEIEAPDEVVRHVEKVKEEVVLGDVFEVWDVTTDKNAWWVISNSTNLYSKEHFVSLDYTLSFHIGLMLRLRSRPQGPDSGDPTPFEDVFRRQEQAKDRFDRAVEAEDYQAVGMQLRECLIALVGGLRRRVVLPNEFERPQDANFVEWSDTLMNRLLPGRSNERLRQHLKLIAKQTWQLVNWLTHDRNANKTASSIAIHSCDTVVGHFLQILERELRDRVEKCPVCSSRKIRSHFDLSLGVDGEYYLSCGTCDWTSHPEFASSRIDDGNP